MGPQNLQSNPVPDITAADDLVKALNLLLHDLRTPLSVAQGYLRLLLEDRLSESKDRQRAIAQSMDALGRISSLCAGAGEFLNASSPAEACRYPAEELVAALAAEAQRGGIGLIVQESLPAGHVRTLAPARAAVAVATILKAALRNDLARTPELSAGVHATDLLVTSGDAATRSRLMAPMGRDVFNPWRGGNGLLVPLAAKQLQETGARIWTLVDDSCAVGIAIPLELEG
jgi:hypothetical protein